MQGGCVLSSFWQFWPAPRINSNVRHNYNTSNNYNSSKKLKCESNTCPTLLILPQLCCKSAQLHISSSDHHHPWLVTTLWYPLTLPEFTRFQQIHTQYIQIYSVGIYIYVDQYMLISKIVLKWTSQKSSSKIALFIWFWNFAGKPNWGAKYVLFFGVQESFWLILQKNNTDYWRKNALWLLLARREEKGLSVFRWWGHVY